jgi:condensation enzyme
MTQQHSSQPDITTERYPLSFTQQYFHSLDEGDLNGAFGNRFTIVSGVRIAGHVDVGMLQGALDDVVERHELLRTVVVRDAEPPYQQVYPPCRVPLEVRDRPVTERSRGVVAEELLIEGEKGTMSARQVPVMRATFTRFDDTDSVLVIVVHHSASDAWSQTVVLRDLAAFYDARANHRPVNLPPVKQYRDYAEWQKAGAGDVQGAGEHRRARVLEHRTDRQLDAQHRPEPATTRSRPRNRGWSAFLLLLRGRSLAEIGAALAPAGGGGVAVMLASSTG